MGKRIITQRRGRGTSTYKAHSHNWVEIKHRPYDDLERKGAVTGKIIDIAHCKGHSAQIA